MLGKASEFKTATIQEDYHGVLSVHLNDWLEKNPDAYVIQIQFNTVDAVVDEYGHHSMRSEALVIYQEPNNVF